MSNKIIIILVGMPARGKSYTSNNLSRYLNWCGINSKVFNCGDYRRKIIGGFQDANFFDFNNQENFNKKEEISKICFNDLINWIDDTGEIAIFDATNSIKERRSFLKYNCGKYSDNLLFVELITNNKDIILNNLNLKIKSQDYVNSRDKKFATDDFKKRIAFYNNIYQTIEDNENLRYIKLINFNEKIFINNVFGINESLVMSYLMNLKLNNFPIYLTRHGQSENNLNMIIGGDPNITNLGDKYAKELHRHMCNEISDDFVIFTSCLNRTIQTAKYFKQDKIHSRLLNEIHGGICENMSYKDIEQIYPKICKERKEDKLRFRYPQGESYIDLIERLKYFVLELNKYNKPILIIAHNAIIKVLLGYFIGIKHDKIPYSEIELNTLIRLTPNSHNYAITYNKLIN